MPLDSPQLQTPLDAIDTHPLTVTPDTSLVEVIGLMSQSPFSSCALDGSGISATTVRSSCVLVMQNQRLEGIFTERDIVRLAAAGQSLTWATVYTQVLLDWV